MPAVDTVVNQTLEQGTRSATYGFATGGTIAGFTVNEFVALCSLGLGVLTLIANIYFKKKMLKVAEAKSENKSLRDE